MDDFTEKLRDILSDEKSMEQIRRLYETVAGDRMKCGNSGEDAVCDEEYEESEEQGDFDFSTLLRLQSLFGNAEKDDAGAALIAALRPHLSSQRQEKADKAIKMLNLFNMAAVLKESGLLGDLI